MANFKRITVEELTKNISVRQFQVLDFLTAHGNSKEPVHTSLLYDSLGAITPQKRSEVAGTVNYLYMHSFIDGRWDVLSGANSIKLNITDKGLEALKQIEANPKLNKSLLLQSAHFVSDAEM